MERADGTVHVRDSGGQRVSFPFALTTSESVLGQIKEPELYPQLSRVSQEFRGWRFYHHFPTHSLAAQRHPQVGVRTPVLDRDGRYLAAALQTIREIGDAANLEKAIDDAFPGSKLIIHADRYTRFWVELKMPGIQRAFEAREFSDGTLRYLCLLAALLSPRPPSLLALNEPETSLHPDLLEPLARLIHTASRYSQMWITTHSAPLAEAIEHQTGQRRIRLEKMDGETRIVGQNALGVIAD
jgi:predicted ATPase